MALTVTQITNTQATSYNVELKFYGGVDYSQLSFSAYTYDVMPNLDAWTDISADVFYSGTLEYKRDDSTLSWTATLSGRNYQAAYYTPGKAIMCLRRITVDGVQTVPATGTYSLFFIGNILSEAHNDTFLHNGNWEITVGGLDSFFARSNAPRISAGRIDLLKDASVQASSTLSTPTLESGTGEFAGTLVNVDPDNTVDNNINTLWISQEAPYNTERDEYTGWFDKVFFKPLTGYDQSLTWWLELHTRENLDYDYFLVNSASQYFWLTLDNKQVDEIKNLAVGSRIIVCSSQADFEAYTGGDKGADKVIEAKSWPFQGAASTRYGPRDGTFTLNPTNDWIELRHNTIAGGFGDVREAFAWREDGNIPQGKSTNWWEQGWLGDSLNSSSAFLPVGYGYRRVASNNVGEHNSASKFRATKHMTPGRDYEHKHNEWLLFTIEGQTATLASDLLTSASSIELTGTTGFLTSGSVICEGDVIAYSNRTSTYLTGASGISASHVEGAPIYQYINGVAQTGMPTTQLQILRKSGLPQPKYGSIYIKKTGNAPRTPEDPDEDDPSKMDWETDYDKPIELGRAINNINDGISDFTFNLVPETNNPYWVKYILLLISRMSDYGRAKINDVKLFLSQTQVDYSNLGDIDDLSSAGLAYYILQQTGLTIKFVYDWTSYEKHLIGEHATAIAPYPEVLNDLARVTGCCIDWQLDGTVSWQPDPWWPFGLNQSQYSANANLDATYLRDQVDYNGERPNETGVKIHARTPDSKRQFTISYPRGLTATNQIIEIDDLVVTDTNNLDALAQAMYLKNGLYYAGGPQHCAFTIKGVGEWVRPDQWVNIYCDNETGETVLTTATNADTVSWLVENVRWEWAMKERFQGWKTVVNCRRYWR